LVFARRRSRRLRDRRHNLSGFGGNLYDFFSPPDNGGPDTLLFHNQGLGPFKMTLYQRNLFIAERRGGSLYLDSQLADRIDQGLVFHLQFFG
jgi:hypothetical protein